MSILSKAAAKLKPRSIPKIDYWKALVKSRVPGDNGTRIHATHMNGDFEEFLVDAQKFTKRTHPNKVCGFLRKFSEEIDSTTWLCGSTAHRMVEIVEGYNAHKTCKHIVPKDYDVMLENYHIGAIGGHNFCVPQNKMKRDLFRKLGSAGEHMYPGGVTFAILGNPARGSHTKDQMDRVIVLGIVHDAARATAESHFMIDLFSQESASDYLMKVPLAHDGVLIRGKSLPTINEVETLGADAYKRIDYIQSKEHSNSLGKQNFVVNRPSSFEVLNPPGFPDKMRNKGIDEDDIAEWQRQYSIYHGPF